MALSMYTVFHNVIAAVSNVSPLSLISPSRCIKTARARALRASPLFNPACTRRRKPGVTNGAKVIHIRRLKSDPGVNLLS